VRAGPGNALPRASCFMQADASMLQHILLCSTSFVCQGGQAGTRGRRTSWSSGRSEGVTSDRLASCTAALAWPARARRLQRGWDLAGCSLCLVWSSTCRAAAGAQVQRSSGVCHPETVQQHMHASAGACATDTLERSTSGAPWIAGRAAATAARQRRWPPQGPYSRARSAAQPCGAPTASAGRGRRRARSRARSTAPAAASTACVAACAQAARR
jgi:hypothetical protein